jgi:hypothetical protein
LRERLRSPWLRFWRTSTDPVGVTREFQQERPSIRLGEQAALVPAIGRTTHVVPIACGGPDTVSNPQRVAAAGLALKLTRPKLVQSSL